MFPILKQQIRMSEFNQGLAAAQQQDRRYLIELAHLNFVVSFAVKNLLEALLCYQQTGASPVTTYFNLSGRQLAETELVQLAKQHIPAALFLEAEIKPATRPFIVSIILLPQNWLKHLTPWCRWLFNRRLATGLFAVFIVLHSALMPAITASVQMPWFAANTPVFIAFMLGSYLIHEMGHVSACARLNCQHGGIGCGIYFIFPVFFADVSKAWTLTARQRVMVDLGGLYFQSISLILIDLYAYQHNSQLAYVISWTVTLTMLHTLNPFFKFDGYWLLSDLSGITNLHEKMSTTMQQLLCAVFHWQRPEFIEGRYLRLLIPYSLLTLLFIFYIAYFLSRQMAAYADTLPLALSQWGEQFMMQTSTGSGIFHALTELLSLLAWPLLIMIISVIYGMKITRIVIGGIRHDKSKHNEGENG